MLIQTWVPGKHPLTYEQNETVALRKIIDSHVLPMIKFKLSSENWDFGKLGYTNYGNSSFLITFSDYIYCDINEYKILIL